MGIFSRSDNKDPDKDPDKVGQNPTGRERRSSAGKRRQTDRKLYNDTKWEEK